MKKNTLFILILLCSIPINNLYAQNDSTKTITKDHFIVEGYVDAYYAYYTDRNKPNQYVTYPIIAPRSNSFGINIIQLSGIYTAEKLRGKFTLQYGDIPINIWPANYRYMQEAYVGIKVGKHTWLDAGFFKTHIGAEIIPNRYNLLSTVAFVTYNEPFFQGGVRLSHESTNAFNWSLHLLNGFNAFTAYNNLLSLGCALSYSIANTTTLSYTNLISNEGINNGKRNFRFYNNISITASVGKRIKLVSGIDWAWQEKSLIDTKQGNMLCGLFTTKYQVNKRFALSLRPEFYFDPKAIISSTISTTDLKKEGMKMAALTLGIEYKAADIHYVRLETRYLQHSNNQKIYRNYLTSNGALTNNRWEVVLTTGLWFEK